MAAVGKCKVCGAEFSLERSCEHVYADPSNAEPAKVGFEAINFGDIRFAVSHPWGSAEWRG